MRHLIVLVLLYSNLAYAGSIIELAKSQGIDPKTDCASSVPQLEKGKTYYHYGYPVQITEKLILIEKMGIKGGDPWAVLVFEDPSKVEGANFQENYWINSIVVFEGFKSFPMANGTEKRLALFTCKAFGNYGMEAIDTTKATK